MLGDGGDSVLQQLVGVLLLGHIERRLLVSQGFDD